VQIQQMTDAEYHSIKDRCSASSLKEFRRSPAHYKLNLDNPKESDSMALGSLFHCLALQPEEFEKRYVQVAKIDNLCHDEEGICTFQIVGLKDVKPPHHGAIDIKTPEINADAISPAEFAIIEGVEHEAIEYINSNRAQLNLIFQ